MLCYQDYTAVGLIIELFRRGKSVPKEVAVAGCDDLAIGNSFSLGVTSYTYASQAIAAGAVCAMASRIAHPNNPPAKIVFRGSLVIRDSSVVA